MAATDAGRLLTEEHRLAQLRTGADTVQTMRDVWPLLDPLDLDGSFPRWSRTALEVLRDQFDTSARLGINYLTSFRALEIGLDGGPSVPVSPVMNLEQSLTSLYVTGPIEAKKQIATGASIEEAMQRAEASSAASGMRQALTGGRAAVMDGLEVDSAARGWARATSARCCAFCAMLASRGPVYLSRSSALYRKDGKRFHDNCACTVEPIFRPDADWPTGSRHYADLWKRAQAAPDATAIEFRRLIEAR